MFNRRRVVAGAAALALAALAAPSFAQPWSDGPRHLSPASILIFPLFDARSDMGFNTILVVVNTNTDTSTCDGNDNLEIGDVTAHYTYINGDDPNLWGESDVFVDLTPGDTLAVLASEHNRDQERGWLWVEARNPDNNSIVIDFDYLIGEAIVVNMDFNFEWAYTPYAFRALAEEHGRTTVDDCGHNIVDDVRNNGAERKANFDGWEYDYFPDELFISFFFGEGQHGGRAGSLVFGNGLYLMSDQNFGTRVDFLFWNNNEGVFSRSFNFDCWTNVSLSDVSNVVTGDGLCSLRNSDRELGCDQGELFDLPYGWAQLRSDDGILGVFMNSVTNGGTLTSGHALHFAGFQTSCLTRLF